MANEPALYIPFDALLDGSANVPQNLGDFDAGEDDLTNGQFVGFAVLSIRGKAWRVKYQGEETPLLDENGDPKRRLLAVIVQANRAVSKTYYPEGYTPGSNEAPTCASADGITPDPGVPEPQHQFCAQCQHNVFGSKQTENGKKAKACADSRRLAVVPAQDLKNEKYGGPMLLRVPAASLNNLVAFNAAIKKVPAAYPTVIVELGFDVDADYPLITFTPRAVITAPAMWDIIREHREGAVAESICYGSTNNDVPMIAANPQQAALPAPTEAPQTAQTTPAATRGRRRAEAAQQPTAKPQPAPASEPQENLLGVGLLNNGNGSAPERQPVRTLTEGAESALANLMQGLQG